MKHKPLLFILSITLTMAVAACGGANAGSSTANSSATSSAQGAAALSQVNKLLVGTLKLEDTDQAVTASEAAQLLTLWQAYQSLSNSQTTAEAEVEALVNQIQSTMTAQQMDAINAMNLTAKDMMDLMQTAGGPMLQGTPNPQGTPGANSSGQVFEFNGPPDGSMGGGPGGSTGGAMPNPPTGGGMVFRGGTIGDAGSAAGLSGGPLTQGTPDQSMQATAQARFTTQASQVNPVLLQVLISKLQAIANG